MSTMVGKLKTIVWDAPDIQALADFYVGAVGLTQHYADDEWVTLYSPDGWRFGVQHAPDHVPPQWPDPAHPQQMHVDFRVADIEAAAARAEGLGARRLAGNEHWITLADPAGHPFDLCQADVEGTTVFAVTIDTDDAPALGRFYSGLLGLDVTYDGPEGVLIGREGEQVMFQQVAEQRRPRWPDPAYPQQLHLDVTVSTDADEAERAALELGATRLPGDGENWRVYADPHGHPFCLLTGVS
jgi:catechol 2,3-dioxygenase-like lactoylglutathione lyase family enzyme